MRKTKSFTIGIDFGTLSGRAMLVDTYDGSEIAKSTYTYPHGVMNKNFLGKEKLPSFWSLQHPKDYLNVLNHVIPELIATSGVDIKNIKGMGIGFTSSTVLPIKKDGTPLCFLPEFEKDPHAYVKLWNHHAAGSQANFMTKVAHNRNESFLKNYGSKISSEWLFPKLLQILNEAPYIFDSMDYFVEAGDWITFLLTGQLIKSACSAGYKAFYSKDTGYPSNDYFISIDKKLDNILKTKLSGPVSSSFTVAGYLTEGMAEQLGLYPGLPISVPMIDAHACFPSSGITSPGKMLAILGTSACYMLLSDKSSSMTGISGVVKDGILPNYYGYEAGLSCFGDHFSWVVDNCMTSNEKKIASSMELSAHEYLTWEAKKLSPGKNGLMALNWWNGNRSPLEDSDLTGLFIGLTLNTTAADMYRALIESTIFGTKVIINNFKEHNIPVEEFIAIGGVSQKNSFIMQTYADILDMPVKVVNVTEAGALGNAIIAAVASGIYKTAEKAILAMSKKESVSYTPNKENTMIYNVLYKEYLSLFKYFGYGENNIMKRLLKIKNSLSQ